MQPTYDLEKFKKQCENRSVILVGNSVEMMNHDNAAFIDSHDIVVRMGKALEVTPEQEKAVGKKIDCWMTGGFRQWMVKAPENKAKIQDVQVLFNRSRLDMSKPFQHSHKIEPVVNLFTDEQIVEVNERYGIDSYDKMARRLSGGLWTMLFFCDRVGTQKSLTMIGYDFFSKQTTKLRGGTYPPHSWHRGILNAKEEVHLREQEIDIANTYVERYGINWVKLGTLDKEIINDTRFGGF
jgi:hypothetical protein